jgi:hypothetical protein
MLSLSVMMGIFNCSCLTAAGSQGHDGLAFESWKAISDTVLCVDPDSPSGAPSGAPTRSI